MEILTPGDKTKIWSAVITCIRCDATLGISESDLTVKESKYMNVSTCNVILDSRVRCPECGCDIPVDKVPREVARDHLPR